MLIKNNSEQDFSFEGTNIKAGETVEVENIQAGRLIALYHHNPLEMIEAAPPQSVFVQEAAPIEKASIDSPMIETNPLEEIIPEPVKTEEANQDLTCPNCGVKLNTQRGLKQHITKIHNK